MSNPNLRILLVNDDPATLPPVLDRLRDGGYVDIRHGSHAELDSLLERRPDVLICAGAAGLALASRVRQLDELADTYTYILLISDAPAAELLDESADRGIDDVVAPAQLDLLLPKVLAADRLCNVLQRLRHENSLLRKNIASLEQRNLVDALTGLGNARYLRQQLSDSLRQIKARGGAICYLLIGLEHSDGLLRENGTEVYDELLQGVARRLQQMVRPLDVLARLDDRHFVLMTLPADLSECAPSSFKRLHDGLNQKGFMTRAGLMDISAGISLIGLDNQSIAMDPQSLFEEASQLLGESYASHLVSAKRLPQRAE